MIIDRLKRRQAELGLSDRKFAKLLKMSQPHWSALANGKAKRPIPHWLKEAVTQFPDLRADLGDLIVQDCGEDAPAA